MADRFLKLVVDKPKRPRRVFAGEPLECSCGSRETYETRIGRTIKNGKVTAGTKQLRCAMCHKVVH